MRYRVGLAAFVVHLVCAISYVDANRDQVYGSGSTLLSAAFEAWSKTFNEHNAGANLTYDPTGSGTGLARLMRNESHWAGSDAPLSDSDFERYPGLQQIPVVLASIALVHNLLGTDGVRVRVLSLDRDAIARIFSLDILWWDDPALRALNPRVLLPHRRINVVVRAESSGTSAIMTESLVRFGWLNTPGCRRTGSGCAVTKHLYRATPGAVGLGGVPLYRYDAARGSSGLVQHVEDTLWSISYVGVATALQYAVPFAVVYNRKGRPTVANRDFTVLSGKSATLDLETLEGDPYDQEGYPLVGFSYVMLWRQVEPSRQFDTIEPEYKGYTKDYKQAVDAGERPNGRNWGWPADQQLHLPGKTCDEYMYVYQFIYWLLRDATARFAVTDLGLVSVPLAVANRALAQLIGGRCEGEPWSHHPLVRFEVRNDVTESVVHELGQAYSIPRGTLHPLAAHSEGHEDHEEADRATVLSASQVEGAHSGAVQLILAGDMHDSGSSDNRTAAEVSGYVPIPIAASAVVLVYYSGVQNMLLPLELPLSAIRGILTGAIRTWRDQTILDYNRYIPLPDLDISICAHRASLRELLIHFELNSLGPAVRTVQQTASGRPIQTPSQVATQVLDSPGTLGVIPLSTAVDWDLSQFYPIVLEGTGGVHPSFDMVEDAVREASWAADLSSTTHGADTATRVYYPFWYVLWLYVREESTAATGEEEEELHAAFDAARWLAGVNDAGDHDSVAASFRTIQFVSLGTCCGLQEQILKLFRRLQVNGQVMYPELAEDSDVVPLWLILLLCGLGLLMIGVVVALFIKNLRDSKNMDLLRNDNAIAERSAEAIADMRLEEMDYLSEIESPNRIQRAFITIVASLKLYRSYIPQTVLQNVQQDTDEVAVEAPTGEVTLMFTDIQQSTFLWETVPEGMELALDNHNRVIRARLRTHRGYEVKTIGDAFMVAFQDPVPALNCALHIQEDLLQSDPPKELQAVPFTKAATDSSGKLLWGGLRIRVGLHCGQVATEVNPLTQRYDYRGPVCNKAARCEAAGYGGTVCLSVEMKSAVEPRLQELYDGAVFITEVKQVTMKGIPGPQKLYLALPPRLKGRADEAVPVLRGEKLNPYQKAGSSGGGRTARASLDAGQLRHSMEATAVATIGDRTSITSSAGGGRDPRRSIWPQPRSLIRTGSEPSTHSTEQTLMQQALARRLATLCCVSLREFEFHSDDPRVSFGSMRYSHFIAVLSELSRRGSGSIVSVLGSMAQLSFGTTQATDDHMMQALNVARIANDRLAFCTLGISTGYFLWGNVGSAQRRYPVATGRVAAVSRALAVTAPNFGVRSLCSYVSGGTPIAELDIALKRVSRLVDIWPAPSVEPIYVRCPDFDLLADQVESLWHDNGAASNRSQIPYDDLDRLVIRACGGDTEAIDALEMQGRDDDAVSQLIAQGLRMRRIFAAGLPRVAVVVPESACTRGGPEAACTRGSPDAGGTPESEQGQVVLCMPAAAMQHLSMISCLDTPGIMAAANSDCPVTPPLLGTELDMTQVDFAAAAAGAAQQHSS